MTVLKLNCQWLQAGADAPPLRHTTGMLTLRVGPVCLTRNEDSWSTSVRDSVLVSAYPLALWIAGAWWRLCHEPLASRGAPALDWRMSHELGAANQGFVWPQIIFAADGETVHVWAKASPPNDAQSVRYLNDLLAPAAIPNADFQNELSDFVSGVLARLEAMGETLTPLHTLWQTVTEERKNPESAHWRRVEALLGYDPDECPAAIMAQAGDLAMNLGEDAMDELAPVYGQTNRQAPFREIEELLAGPGLFGQPSDPRPIRQQAAADGSAPWQRAVAAARTIREALGNERGVIDNSQIQDLLGLPKHTREKWLPPARRPAGLALPDSQQHGYKFIPRKSHPLAKRFEMARFYGDFLQTSQTTRQALANTDLVTARQKYQRAFAAELLCPIAGLQAYIDGDYSESALEEAAQHYQVSLQTVVSLLANNGLLSGYGPFDPEQPGLPYALNHV